MPALFIFILLLADFQRGGSPGLWQRVAGKAKRPFAAHASAQDELPQSGEEDSHAAN